MSCCLYKVGFAETALVISAAPSVSASPRAGHHDPVIIQVGRYRFPPEGMLSSLDRLLTDQSSSLGLHDMWLSWRVIYLTVACP